LAFCDGNGGGDVITLGAGNDIVLLSTLSAGGALNATATSATVTDFVVGTTATATDTYTVNVTAIDPLLFGGVGGTLTNAAGTSLIAAPTNASFVSVNAGQVTSIAASTANIVKIIGSTNATAGNTAQQGFVAALNGGTVTLNNAFNNTDRILVTYYDSANGQAVLGAVDANANTQNTIDAADNFTVLVRTTMSSADFTNFGNVNFGAFV